MGFGPSEWINGEDGEPHTASGLRLLPRDMLKVGQLALADGAWNGKPKVPAALGETHHSPMVEIRRTRSYGYHWYIGELRTGTPHLSALMGGIGWGGQRLLAFPALDLVVAMN